MTRRIFEDVFIGRDNSDLVIHAKHPNRLIPSDRPTEIDMYALHVGSVTAVADYGQALSRLIQVTSKCFC